MRLFEWIMSKRKMYVVRCDYTDEYEECVCLWLYKIHRNGRYDMSDKRDHAYRFRTREEAENFCKSRSMMYAKLSVEEV